VRYQRFDPEGLALNPWLKSASRYLDMGNVMYHAESWENIKATKNFITALNLQNFITALDLIWGDRCGHTAGRKRQ
jgi:hypothetical protein